MMNFIVPVVNVFLLNSFVMDINLWEMLINLLIVKIIQMKYYKLVVMAIMLLIMNQFVQGIPARFKMMIFVFKINLIEVICILVKIVLCFVSEIGQSIC